MGLVTHPIESRTILADSFWSSGITGSVVKISKNDEALVNIRKQFQTNLQNTLSLIQGVNQTDVSLFLALASEGDFAAQEYDSPRVHNDRKSAFGFSSRPLETYLIISALAQNN